jgi:hypothetical protein
MNAHLLSAAALAAFVLISLPREVQTSGVDGPGPFSLDGGVAPNATIVDLAGMYECEGTSAQGDPYRGFVDIVRHAATYQLMWILATGERHLGLGIVSEDGGNLAVSYFGSVPGIVSYRVARDGQGSRLLGKWTATAADGHVYRETLTRIGPGSNHLYFRVLPRAPAGSTERNQRRPA